MSGTSITAADLGSPAPFHILRLRGLVPRDNASRAIDGLI